MTNLDVLLPLANDSVAPPADFVSRVMRMLPNLRERLYRRAVVRSAALLCVSLIFFFWSLSLLMDSLTSLDLWGMMIEEPDVLSLKESWYALFESLPLLPLVLAAALLLPVLSSSRTFVRSLLSA